MIKIRIRNDGCETDIRFPISENKLYAKIAEINAIKDGDALQSAFVTEVYWPERFSILKDRFVNLDELNYLGKRMESFDTIEYDQFLIGISKLNNPTEKDLINLMASGQSLDFSGESTNVLEGVFAVYAQVNFRLLNLLSLIVFSYCVIKTFFQNIKCGGILLVQMAVRSLYMFSVPRGYTDGFNQWVKQIIAICLTAFMQTTLLFLGLLTFPDHMLMGLGIMLAANEVPRIAQQFGLDSSVRVNMMSVVHATTTAVNLTRSVAKASGK